MAVRRIPNGERVSSKTLAGADQNPPADWVESMVCHKLHVSGLSVLGGGSPSLDGLTSLILDSGELLQ